MNPTNKSEIIESLLSSFIGKSRSTTIKTNMCTLCNNEANSFKDEISKQEYMISGICQKCQDSIFLI